jgi:hypothetical protein
LSNRGREETERCDLRSKTHRFKLNNMGLLNELFPLVRQVEAQNEQRDSLSVSECTAAGTQGHVDTRVLRKATDSGTSVGVATSNRLRTAMTS